MKVKNKSKGVTIATFWRNGYNWATDRRQAGCDCSRNRWCRDPERYGANIIMMDDFDDTQAVSLRLVLSAKMSHGVTFSAATRYLGPGSHIRDAKIQIRSSLIKIKETSLGALHVWGEPFLLFCQGRAHNQPFILPEAHNSVRLWPFCTLFSYSSAYAPHQSSYFISSRYCFLSLATVFLFRFFRHFVLQQLYKLF